MCRRNRMLGLCLMMFGVGMLIGRWLHSAFLVVVGGFALVVLGYIFLSRR